MCLASIKKFLRLDEHKIFMLLIFCFPLFAFVIKKWVGVWGALIFLFSLFQIFRKPSLYFNKKGVAFFGWIFSLTSPFIVSVLVQFLRSDEFEWAVIDGPSRFLMAAFLFIYLSRRDSFDFLRSLYLPICITLIITVIVAALSFESNQFWQRWSTYFVDPNTLPTYVISLFALCVPLSRWKTSIEKILFLFVFVSVILLLFFSQSRSSWNGAMVLLFCSAFIFYLNGEFKFFAIGGLIFIGLLVSLNLSFGVVSVRYSDMFKEISEFFVGNNTSTSVGTRLGLLVFAWDLFWLNPLLGTPDGVLPSLEALKAMGIEVSRVVHEDMRLAGPHNQLVAYFLRYGVLGFLPVFGIFVVPLFVSFSYGFRLRFQNIDSDLARGLFMFILILLTCAQTIEVLNLKMTSTIYATYLALFLSALYNQGSLRKLCLKNNLEKK